MRFLRSFLLGAAIFVAAAAMIAAAFVFAADQWIKEDEGRMARQLQQDKRLMLIVPAVYKIKNRTFEECQIVNDELQCGYRNKNGEYGIVAVK